MSAMQPLFIFVGSLKGHTGWVTQIATPHYNCANQDMIFSSSRDKSIIAWDLTKKSDESYGIPLKSLTGHSHFVQDIALSNDCSHLVSGSWDGTLRLWNVNKGKRTRTFIGHKKDVLSVAFSPDNRQIVSSSRDTTIKLWNTRGECKWTSNEQGHKDWVSQVRFSPRAGNQVLVSASWDKMAKVWDLQKKQVHNLIAHEGPINALDISPDASIAATGGYDGKVIIWDLLEGKSLMQFDELNVIHALAFSPTQHWLCGAATFSIKCWDLERQIQFEEVKPKLAVSTKERPVEAISLAWSSDGQTLYAGYTDNNIRVYHLQHKI